MAETSHDIRTLNGLIATVIDSVDGYSESAKDVDSPRFSEVFLSVMADRLSMLGGRLVSLMQEQKVGLV